MVEAVPYHGYEKLGRKQTRFDFTLQGSMIHTCKESLSASENHAFTVLIGRVVAGSLVLWHCEVLGSAIDRKCVNTWHFPKYPGVTDNASIGLPIAVKSVHAPVDPFLSGSSLFNRPDLCPLALFSSTGSTQSTQSTLKQ